MIAIVKKIVRRFYRMTAIRSNVVYANDLRVGRGTYVTAPRALTIGKKVSIGAQCWIACDGKIGDGVLISSYVGIAGRRDHNMRDIGNFISESAWVYDQQLVGDSKSGSIEVGDDVWIGFGAIILSGISIGRGAVIGAGAVVASDVEPYSIVVGNPARQVGMRFDETERVQHEDLLAKKQR